MHPAWGRNSVEKQCNLIIKCKHMRDQVYSIKTSQAFSHSLSLIEALLCPLSMPLLFLSQFLPFIYLCLPFPSLHSTKATPPLCFHGGWKQQKEKESDLFVPMAGTRSNPVLNSAGIHVYKAGVQVKVIISKEEHSWKLGFVIDGTLELHEYAILWACPQQQSHTLGCVCLLWALLYKKLDSM